MARREETVGPPYDAAVDRRSFLAGLGALAGATLAGCGATGSARRAPSSTARARARASRAVREVDGLPVADWVVEENARPGTLAWVIPASTPTPSGIEGFADQVSVARGDELGLYVNTPAASFRAEVYRMGFYNGLGGRLVARSAERRGRAQPPPVFTPGINMVECHWDRSLALEIGAAFLPGNYLVKLVGSGGELHYVPFTVRDDESRAAIVLQSSVTTWQAYNLWGGYSLYGGVPVNGLSNYESRSRVVSFDRPYGHPPLDPYGSGDWVGNEFPVVYLAERHGLDVTYATDLDLHRHPERLLRHRCLVSLGHDEYWSAPMRSGALAALARGVNLAFLGANACYRHIRFEPSPLGADRREVCYKDGSDPIARTDPAAGTQNWADPPDPRPESELIGSMYQSYQSSSTPRAPLVVVDASSWVLAGTKVHDGTHVPGVIGPEFDAFEPGLPGPRDVEVLGHSPTESVNGPLFSDMTYYTRARGGGVFATGTANWVTLSWTGEPALANRLAFGVAPAMPFVTRVTLNVLGAFARGPASAHHPAKANWQRFYRASAPAAVLPNAG